MKKIILFSLHLTSALFVAKAADPIFQWARRAGGSGADNANSIAVDDSGNTYTTGTFYETVEMHGRKGSALLPSNGEMDVFILKLNALGDFVWAVQIGGPSFEYASEIAIDNESNVYITGCFESTVDFDPGPGVFNLTSNGSRDVYILKLNGAGKFIWAKNIGGNWNDEGLGICADVHGNAYLTGFVLDSVDLDPGIGTLNVFSEFTQVFVSKFNPSGDLVWSKNLEGDNASRGFSIKTDINGNVYINGDFHSKTDFDPGTGKYMM